MKQSIIDFAAAIACGLIIMYMSFILRVYIPESFSVRVDWQAELLALVVLASIAALSFRFKRYTFLAGIVFSYFVFYIAYFYFISLACKQGVCL